MKNHTDLLNHLAKTYRLKSYLEIGVQNPNNNFNMIDCPDKTGVDPEVSQPLVHQMTSDEFFSRLEKQGSVRQYDLIFIDGLHTADQVRKDFENSLRYLSPGGFIVLHDCNPLQEIWSKVPRVSRVWTGDVYKFASTLSHYADINYIVVDCDYGCGVVWRGKQEIVVRPEITWSFFDQNRQALLNLVPENLYKSFLPKH